MSESSLALPSSYPQNFTNEELRTSGYLFTQRRAYTNHHASHRIPNPTSSLPIIAKSRDAKASESVTKFDRRTMENVFQGLNREDGELHKDSTLCRMRMLG